MTHMPTLNCHDEQVYSTQDVIYNNTKRPHTLGNIDTSCESDSRDKM